MGSDSDEAAQLGHHRQRGVAAGAGGEFKLVEQQGDLVAAVVGDGALAFAQRAEMAEVGVDGIADELAFVFNAGEQVGQGGIGLEGDDLVFQRTGRGLVGGLAFGS